MGTLVKTYIIYCARLLVPFPLYCIFTSPYCCTQDIKIISSPRTSEHYISHTCTLLLVAFPSTSTFLTPPFLHLDIPMTKNKILTLLPTFPSLHPSIHPHTHTSFHPHLQPRIPFPWPYSCAQMKDDMHCSVSA